MEGQRWSSRHQHGRLECAISVLLSFVVEWLWRTHDGRVRITLFKIAAVKILCEKYSQHLEVTDTKLTDSFRIMFLINSYHIAFFIHLHPKSDLHTGKRICKRRKKWA